MSIGIGWFAATPAQAGPQGLDFDITTFETQVVQIVNVERAALGRSALVSEARLWNSVEGHTMWMAQTHILSHTGAGGSSLASRALGAGYNQYLTLGETIAQGHSTPEQVVRGLTCDAFCSTACDSSNRCDGWKQSPGHWNILMSTQYRDIGVAYVRGATAPFHWWTVDVGNSRDAPVPLGGTGGSVTPPPATGIPSSTPVPTASSTPRPTASPTTVPGGSSTFATLYGTVQVQGRTSDLRGIGIFVDGVQAASTGDSGAFVLLGIVPGTRTIEARQLGALASRKVVQVGARQVIDLGTTRLLAGNVYPDSRIDFFDVFLIQAALGRCRGSTSYQVYLDLNRDGCVTSADINLAQSNLNRVGPTGWGLN